jgi:hypothetical protein
MKTIRPHSTVNVDIRTGIHYGVIHSNKLGEFAFDEIQSNGTDLDHAEVLSNLHSELEQAINSVLGDCCSGFDAKTLAADIIGDLSINVEPTGDCTRYAYKGKNEEFIVGSDGDIFVTKSKFYTLCGMCSPCAPNAGDLTSEGSLKTYCLGPDWFDEHNPIPYKVYTDESLCFCPILRNYQ